MSAETAVDLSEIAGRRTHFLAIEDQSPDEIRSLIDLALSLKQAWRERSDDRPLQNRILGMVFERPSLRTRASFEVGMKQLGGHAMYLAPHEVELGSRETVPDVARVLSRYVDAILLRTGPHQRVLEMARHATVPVINGLSEREHPCQAMADLLTIREHRGTLSGVRLAYVGDGNNVCSSLILAAAKLGLRIRLATPPAYRPPDDILRATSQACELTGGELVVTSSPEEAVRGADVVYTDVWTSMGQERESAERRAAFAGYQVNVNLMKSAGDAVVMHCLPAHRGEEITDEVIEGPDSIVFDQAENRVHAQKAILYQLLR